MWAWLPLQTLLHPSRTLLPTCPTLSELLVELGTGPVVLSLDTFVLCTYCLERAAIHPIPGLSLETFFRDSKYHTLDETFPDHQ